MYFLTPVTYSSTCNEYMLYVITRFEVGYFIVLYLYAIKVILLNEVLLQHFSGRKWSSFEKKHVKYEF